ncbi:hypothetical protein BKA70DRAFT_1266451 [Coprinopsis sp. MPI-PUGE-AT-0042]|nr:hypothetical protein BKA70DRAFT_1266451 [Coprinopsis sp. MPI-PUGE-AT-0042]
MVSLLEGIPYDVLLQVALFAASDASLGPPSALPSLLLTNKRMFRDLSVDASPQLYASLFHRHFDPPKFFPTARGIVPATTLAREYVARYKVLRRSRLASWRDEEFLDDMRCALRMVCESEGLNEVHLAAHNFPTSLLVLAETRLPGGGASEAKSLIVWLLSLTLSRADIALISVERLDRILSLLHGFVVTSTTASQNHWFPDLTTFFRHPIAASPIHRSRHLVHPSQTAQALAHHFSAVQPCFAAMTVIFALQEMCPVAIPPHLPLTRAIALANNLNGPTQEDMHEFQSFRTPLFADAIPRNPFTGTFTIPGRCLSHDPGFQSIFGAEGEVAHPYRPGAFAGLWKGSMMYCKSDNSDEKEFFNRRPIEVLVKAYHCFAPRQALPLSNDEKGFNSFPFQPWDMQNVEDLQALLEQHHYVEVTHNTNGSGSSDLPTRQLPTSPVFNPSSEIVDTILFGETTDDYDQAWKGFRYLGRVHKDGLVLLKRKPKQAAEDYLGVNLFEGRLRFGRTLVGRWRHSDDTTARGIFALATDLPS